LPQNAVARSLAQVVADGAARHAPLRRPVVVSSRAYRRPGRMVETQRVS
jgi:hypothetical protein